jgi:hypothetical protein
MLIGTMLLRLHSTQPTAWCCSLGALLRKLLSKSQHLLWCAHAPGRDLPVQGRLFVDLQLSV